MSSLFSAFDSDLFGQFEEMRRQMNRLFGEGGVSNIRSVSAGAFPTINVGASPKQVDVFVYAAGVNPESLDVSLQKNLLTISGERKAGIPEGAQAYRKERFSGSFKRTMSLPDDVDPDHVSAEYKDGIVHITVQRRSEVQPRKITVK